MKHLIIALIAVVASGNLSSPAYAAKKHKQKVTTPSQESAPDLSTRAATSPAVEDVDAHRLSVYVGPLLGLAIPGGANTNLLTSRFSWGADLGTLIPQTHHALAAGVYYFRSTQAVTPLRNESISLYGLEGMYYFRALAQNVTWMKYLRAGVRLGLSNLAVDQGTSQGNTSPFSFGPVLGFDLPVAPKITAGIEANEMFLLSASSDTATSSSFHLTNFFVTAKYWF